MNLILSNYRYFISGGPERYLFSIKEIFENRGISVFPFSVRSKRNVHTPLEKHFLSPVSKNDTLYFADYDRSLSTIIRVLARQFYSLEAYVKSKRFSTLVRGDLVYSLHFLNKMSPAVLDGFKSTGIPVVVRVSDFGLICPKGTLYSNGAVCERCIRGSFLNCISRRCIFGSTAASVTKALAWTSHRLIGTLGRVDAFVFPSRFTMIKYILAGFPGQKCYHIPTCVDTGRIRPNSSYDNYILYFGTLSKEKGVHHLLKAYTQIPGKKLKLILIGDSPDRSEKMYLKANYSSRVDFLDFMPGDRLNHYIQKAAFVVVPSDLYDNLPNALLESYAHGKSVIAPRHGCFEEVVHNEVTGLFFEPGNVDDLAEKISWAMLHPQKMAEMGKIARSMAESYHSPHQHFERLARLFKRYL